MVEENQTSWFLYRLLNDGPFQVLTKLIEEVNEYDLKRHITPIDIAEPSDSIPICMICSIKEAASTSINSNWYWGEHILRMNPKNGQAVTVWEPRLGRRYKEGKLSVSEFFKV